MKCTANNKARVAKKGIVMTFVGDDVPKIEEEDWTEVKNVSIESGEGYKWRPMFKPPQESD